MNKLHPPLIQESISQEISGLLPLEAAKYLILILLSPPTSRQFCMYFHCSSEVPKINVIVEFPVASNLSLRHNFLQFYFNARGNIYSAAPTHQNLCPPAK